MREYSRNGKPVIHSTDIYNYFEFCPHAVELNRTSNYQSDNMWKGLMLESFAIGWKDEERNKEFIRERIINGTKFNKNGTIPADRKRLLDNLYQEAKVIKPYFKSGRPFNRIEIEFNDYILTGEIDCDFDDVMKDCKRVKNFEYYDEITTFPTLMKLFQAVYYPYIHFLNTGKVKPFEYVCYSYELNVVKVYRCDNPQMMFRELKKKIDIYVNDIFKSHKIGMHCDEAGFNGCRNKHRCSEYLKQMTQKKIFMFETLEMEADQTWTDEDIKLLYDDLQNL